MKECGICWLVEYLIALTIDYNFFEGLIDEVKDLGKEAFIDKVATELWV